MWLAWSNTRSGGLSVVNLQQFRGKHLSIMLCVVGWWVVGAAWPASAGSLRAFLCVEDGPCAKNSVHILFQSGTKPSCSNSDQL